MNIFCVEHLSDNVCPIAATRSICEILYMCGSNGRPIPCHCGNTLEAIYEESLVVSDSNTGQTFADVCPAPAV